MLTVPGLCWLCRMPLALSRWGICSVCTRSLQWRIGICPQCGLPATNPSLPCGRCLKKSPPWSALVAVDDYVPPLSRLIHALNNQSDLLCRPLARWLGCRYAASALRRVQATAIQHQLSARLRKRNLKNAFRLELPVHGLHIALVDDVVTTGSTVAELSRLLLQSGAASVQVWCLCRTL